MRIAVVGIGGVGGYFGGRLALVGEEVVFIARGANLRAIQASGLRVDSADGDFIAHPALATDDPAAAGPVDVVILAVKGWQTEDAIASMRPLVGNETLIVPLLNGVEAPSQLAATYGASRVAGGLCGLFGSVVGPGHIRNAMPQPFITIGELDGMRTERIQRLAQAFEHTGVRTEIAPDIRAALWEKLMFVGPVGGVAAVARAPFGVVRAQPETRALLEGAVTELCQLGRARGLAVTDASTARALALVDGSPASATTSLQRDIMAGRPSELETQIGAVTRMAVESSFAVPVHTYLYASLLPQERRARGEITFPE